MKLFKLFISILIIGFTKIGFALPLNQLQLPPHFSIHIYAELPNVRSLALGPNGIVFASSMVDEKIYAILPDANYNKANKIITLDKNLNVPNGIAFYQNDLYIITNNAILRYPAIANNLTTPPKPIIITDKLPTNRTHGWRYLKAGADGWLYVSIGASCNVCISDNPIYATILRIHPDTGATQIYASGIRNSMGYDWDPLTKQLWFTDNGRDWLGGDVPPDELNYVKQPGQHYGFPFFYGKNIADPQYGKLAASTEQFTSSAFDLPSHSAALGMLFYTGSMFPNEYRNQAIIALHGSWNRPRKIGYQLVLIKFNQARQPISSEPFVSGWLQGQEVWGRPVDLLTLPDGSLLVTDDKAGVIYRITYTSQ